MLSNLGIFWFWTLTQGHFSEKMAFWQYAPLLTLSIFQNNFVVLSRSPAPCLLSPAPDLLSHTPRLLSSCLPLPCSPPHIWETIMFWWSLMELRSGYKRSCKTTAVRSDEKNLGSWGPPSYAIKLFRVIMENLAWGLFFCNMKLKQVYMTILIINYIWISQGENFTHLITYCFVVFVERLLFLLAFQEKITIGKQMSLWKVTADSFWIDFKSIVWMIPGTFIF